MEIKVGMVIGVRWLKVWGGVRNRILSCCGLVGVGGGWGGCMMGCKKCWESFCLEKGGFEGGEGMRSWIWWGVGSWVGWMV